MALDGGGARKTAEFQMRSLPTAKEKVSRETGVSRAISKVIFQRTGILVPLGSGVAFMNPIAKKIIVV